MARSVGKMLLLAAVYVLAGKLGLRLAFENQSVSPVWPPTGIALTGLILFGWRCWPAVMVGAFVVNFLNPVSWVTSCGIAAGNTIEALAAWWLLQRVGFDAALERTRDVAGLLLAAAVLSTTLSATIGVTSLCLSGAALWSSFGGLWWQWWLGDAMGDLVILPLVLTWRTRPGFTPRQWMEMAALLVSVLGVSQAVFGGWFQTGVLSSPYWIFPFLIWAALRFGQRGVAAATPIVSVMAIWSTLNGAGPFVRPTAAESLVLLQAFLGVTAVTGLVMAAVTAERQTAEGDLRSLNNQLEHRVAERTVELAAANRELARRTEENETFVYSVSHDLRSPLVNLQGFSNELNVSGEQLRLTLAHDGVPPLVREQGLALLDGEIAESLRFIRSAVSRLSDIIDSLLRLSRLRRVVYTWASIDLDATVRHVVDSLHSTVASRRARVTVMPLPSVWGDQMAVEQIFANLIGNALNYLDEARPGLVEVSCADEPEEGLASGFRTFVVRDNGVGIPEAHRPKLFQAFQRLHPDRAPGSGLGLSIVRNVVDRHGGRIWVESAHGVGSAFFVSLPTAPPPDAQGRPFHHQAEA